ncbi:hypothetical protein DFAR_220014 [Desulfarculales bacterium]
MTLTKLMRPKRKTAGDFMDSCQLGSIHGCWSNHITGWLGVQKRRVPLAEDKTTEVENLLASALLVNVSRGINSTGLWYSVTQLLIVSSRGHLAREALSYCCPTNFNRRDGRRLSCSLGTARPAPRIARRR